MDDLLDNPVWSSLHTLHAALAEGDAAARRYPSAIAPFVAVARAGDPVPAELMRPGEDAVMLGVIATPPAGWRVVPFTPILQMVCEHAPAIEDGPEVVRLHDPQPVHALTQLVYPHYFRARTMDLGRYFGILDGTRLAAMAGERMGMPGLREISAVCTHPDFVGRGLARRVLAFLAADILAAGMTPFLHVSPDNRRARELYERTGWRVRAEIPFAALRMA